MQSAVQKFGAPLSGTAHVCEMQLFISPLSVHSSPTGWHTLMVLPLPSTSRLRAGAGDDEEQRGREGEKADHESKRLAREHDVHAVTSPFTEQHRKPSAKR